MARKRKGAHTADRKVPNPEGSPGKPDHQRTVERLARQERANYPDDTQFEILVNRSIKPHSGVNRRPDVAVIHKPTFRVVKVDEAARHNKDGTFVSRERKKVDEYNKAGIPVHVEPVT